MSNCSHYGLHEAHYATQESTMSKAANLPRGTEADFRKPAGVLFPVIDKNRCEGKAPCIEVCPVDVFRLGKLPVAERANLTLKGKLKGFVHGWKQALVEKPEVCRACGLCVTACPENAIKLSAASRASAQDR
jgi:4Fe-4S ferredoxin